MPKRLNTEYFLYDDGIFDYQPLIEPTSERQMLGYKAVAWNTGLQWTGWWQGRNVIGMSTTDPLFNMAGGDISQAVQIQHKWQAGQNMVWQWEPAQGVNDKITFSADVAMPVSYGTNLRQAFFVARYEDLSSYRADWGHGQRIWIQPIIFDNKLPNRGLTIERDPYTDNRDIVVSVAIKAGEVNDFFDFRNSASSTGTAFNDLRDYEFTQTRQQFHNLTHAIEKAVGVDLQNEAGWWSLLQAGISPEMASFPTTDWRSQAWGIGDHGAMQMAVMNLEVYDG